MTSNLLFHSFSRSIGTCCLVCMLLCCNQWAQSQSISDIRSRFEIAKTESKKAELAEELAWLYRGGNLDSLRYFSKLSIQLAKKNSQTKVMAYALGSIAAYHKRQGEYDSSAHAWSQSLQLRKALNDTNDIAGAYLSLGLLEITRGNNKTALTHFDDGLALLQDSIRYYQTRARILSGKGLALQNMGKFPEALSALQQALSANQAIGDSSNISKCLLNLGQFLQETNRKALAKNYYNDALQIALAYGNTIDLAKVYESIGTYHYQCDQLDSALYFLEDNRLRVEALGIPELIYNNANNLALVYQARGDLSAAESYFRKDLQYSLDNKLWSNANQTRINIARLLLAKKDYKAAIEITQESNSNGMLNKSLLSSLYDINAQAESGLGNFRVAAEWYAKKDSLQAESMRDAIELQDLTDKVEIANQNAALNAEKLARIEAETRNTALAAMLLGMGFVIIALLYWVQRMRVKKLKAEALIADARDREHVRVQQIQTIMQDAEMVALRASMETQEKERKRIARELHDRIGSKLSLVQITLDSAAKHFEHLSEKAETKFISGMKNLDEACEEVREISKNLIAGDLARYGLQHALERFCYQVAENSNLRFRFEPSGLPLQLTQSIENEVYAIVRTLVENILKHAKAQSFSISMKFEDEHLNISVEDDGKGFKQDEAIAKTGNGLKNVRNRVAALNGTTKIKPIPSIGTKIEVSIPCLAQKT